MYIGEWFYLQDKSITDNQQNRSPKEENNFQQLSSGHVGEPIFK